MWLAEHWSADLPSPCTHRGVGHDTAGRPVGLLRDGRAARPGRAVLGMPLVDDPAPHPGTGIGRPAPFGRTALYRPAALRRVARSRRFPPAALRAAGTLGRPWSVLRRRAGHPLLRRPAGRRPAAGRRRPWSPRRPTTWRSTTTATRPAPGLAGLLAPRRHRRPRCRRCLVAGGRAWVNTAVSVPEASRRPGGGEGKRRVMLAHRWAIALEPPGWRWSIRWRGTRSVARGRRGARGTRRRRPTCAATGGHHRRLPGRLGAHPPAGLEEWRDGRWLAGLVLDGLERAPRRRCGRGIRRRSRSSWPAVHPPVDLARRGGARPVRRLRHDPARGPAARPPGDRDRALGAYCALAVDRLAQGAFDFGGAA